jgi:YHS domain-containing protein
MMATGTQTETDPICGMAVDARQAAGSSERDGKTFYFCSTACKSRFDSRGEPEAHLCCRR